MVRDAASAEDLTLLRTSLTFPDRLVVEYVEHSERELEAIQGAISDELDGRWAHLGVNMVFVSTDENKVWVAVRDACSEADAAAWWTPTGRCKSSGVSTYWRTDG